MLFDNAIADAQAEAGAFAHTLSGIERIENAIWLFDARAGILELGNHTTFLRVYPDFQGAASPRLQHRVYPIINNVQKDLFQLMRIGSDRWNCGFDISLDRYAIYFQIVVPQG